MRNEAAVEFYRRGRNRAVLNGRVQRGVRLSRVMRIAARLVCRGDKTAAPDTTMAHNILDIIKSRTSQKSFDGIRRAGSGQPLPMAQTLPVLK